MSSYLDPQELWNLPPKEFNTWRRENDLLDLFNVFSEKLPFFQDWLDENSLTISFILETDNPGQFFFWRRYTYCFKETKAEFTNYFFVTPDNDTQDRQIQKTSIEAAPELERFRFLPYFEWASRNRDEEKPSKGPFFLCFQKYEF